MIRLVILLVMDCMLWDVDFIIYLNLIRENPYDLRHPCSNAFIKSTTEIFTLLPT